MAREQAQNVESVTHGGVTLKVYEVDRGHRKIFSVAHKENGRRQLKQFSDQGAALTWALNRAKEIDRGKTPSLMLSPDEAAIYRRAKQILAGTGRALDEVAREYVDARDTLGGAVRLDDAATYYAERRLRLVQRTVPEVVDELLEARAHKSARHVKDLRGRLGRFKRDVTGYIANVTQRDLALWLRGLGLSSRSHDNFRQVLVLLFRFAQKQGYLPEGRTEAEKTEPMGDNGDGEIAIFTADEMRRLLSAAGNDVLPYLALGAFAGIRTAEIVRLDWQEINFETGYIEIKKSKAKTKGRRLIKMQPNLVAWLKKAVKPSGPVTPLARPEKTASEVIAAKLDPAIPWKRNGLRHSYCTYRMAVLQNEHQVSAEMGNSPAMVYANYRALATKEQGEQWFNIMPEQKS
ncbi:MAG: site-specific integrase [Methylacidiphilales bacterium]|nr:site-specific integrase [Candidatus Methylacidiphilales bacterium]